MNKLIFIYNAGSGPLDLIGDGVKKVLGKGTCSLCNASYGIVTPKKKWKEYLATFKVRPKFYHRDDLPNDIQEFVKENKVKLPVVLSKNTKELNVIVKASEMDRCDGDVDCLIDLVKRAVK